MGAKTRAILTTLVVIFSVLVLWNVQMITHDVKKSMPAYISYPGELPFVARMYIDWSVRAGRVVAFALMAIFAAVFLAILIPSKKVFIGIFIVICLILGLWTGLAHYALVLPL